MKADIRDCFEQVIVLNRTLSSRYQLHLQGHSGYWGLYENDKQTPIKCGLLPGEMSLILDGIQWGLKNQ